MSSYSMCKKIQSQGTFSPLTTEEEAMLSRNKQGIVSILGSVSDRDRAPVAATSLRRTLSADMSSKKWLSQNVQPLMKKIASSEQFSHSKVAATSHHDSFSSSSSEGEEEIEEAEVKVEQERLKIWSTIQREKKPEEESRSETWSSILFNKAKEETFNSILTPYIHPLVKRSKSSLSDKSLEICTESLGSETGCDVLVFSPDSNSASTQSKAEEVSEENKEEQVIAFQMQEHQDDDELLVEKQNLHVVKKSLPRCFPPPLPSLHNMRSRRGEGRLFLEAVPAAPKQNNKFCAQRQDGRLVLTFESNEEEEDYDEEDGVMELEEDDDYEEEDEETEHEAGEDEVVENVMNEAPFMSSVDGLASSMMNKPIGVVNNRNTRNWSENKFNKVVNFEDVDVHVAHSLPPKPRVTMTTPSAASFNAYEPFWHTPIVSSPLPKPLNGGNLKASSCGDVNWTSRDGQQQLVVMRGKNGGYLVHTSKSCKDSRRSFLFWGPHCIAT